MEPGLNPPPLYGCYRHPDRATAIRCQRCLRPICPECSTHAAVGVHCPECLAAGRHRTGQVQGRFGGTPSKNPALTSIVLIVVNVALWLATFLTGSARSVLVPWLALQPVSTCITSEAAWAGVPQATCEAGAGMWFPGIADGAWWQLLTSAFMHVQPWHIGFNMLALWVLGPQLESVLGRARFLALYFVSALAGSVTVYWLAATNTSTLGASGAIFGLMGALLLAVWRLGGNPRSILFWLGANVVLTFTMSSISWQGHLGGLAGGLVVAAILMWGPKKPATQWLLVTGFVVFLILAIALRSVVLVAF